ncbi:ABC transporter substrate-binding protein [Ruminiclostridium cellobioparum]|uniref:ABC transporter substrate-binding protein n=1 Tax=Ruminiclostridium cellobioparum TaxID=29355 RepID=UPI000A927591|nr:ABC transporter substrate-binding protein [Ruminiclostridium cellobioparum]
MHFQHNMNVRVKKINIILLIMVFSINLISCSEQNNSTNSSKSQLTIYLMDSDKTLLNAVDKYNKVNSNAKIEAKVFSDIQEFKNKNTTGLLSGNGPDIIVNRLDMLSNTNKVVSNGVFYDINKLITEDRDFKLSDYNEKILDYGVYAGKRYLIPINYVNSGFLTTQEILNKNNIKLDENNLMWNNVAEIVKKFIADNKSKGKYFINSLSFTQFLCSLGNPFIDYDKKKTSYASKEFIEVLNFYKDIYPAICPGRISSKYSYTELLKNGTVVMVNTAGIYSPYSLYEAYNQITRLFNKQEVRIFAFPTWNKGDVNTVWPYYLLSINAKCKSKPDAFAFIKLLLSDEYQQQAGKDDPNWYTPVSESAYNLDKKFCLSK